MSFWDLRLCTNIKLIFCSCTCKIFTASSSNIHTTWVLIQWRYHGSRISHTLFGYQQIFGTWELTLACFKFLSFLSYSIKLAMNKTFDINFLCCSIKNLSVTPIGWFERNIKSFCFFLHCTLLKLHFLNFTNFKLFFHIFWIFTISGLILFWFATRLFISSCNRLFLFYFWLCLNLAFCCNNLFKTSLWCSDKINWYFDLASFCYRFFIQSQKELFHLFIFFFVVIWSFNKTRVKT